MERLSWVELFGGPMDGHRMKVDTTALTHLHVVTCDGKVPPIVLKPDGLKPNSNMRNGSKVHIYSRSKPHPADASMIEYAYQLTLEDV